MNIKYRLWVDGDGVPKVVECLEELDTDAVEALIKEFDAARGSGGVLILNAGWEVRVL